jgi:diadenosine tetraphosphate (Ap4A) HIT family hydrolase
VSAGATCELCAGPGGELIWRDDRCRVIRVDDDNFPGFCRVVWNAHVTELSDLAECDRSDLMKVVCAVEAAVRAITGADKINLASFGNVVPHLHWHVIPRWRDDSHFPQPIWGSPQRPGARRKVDNAALARLICNRLAAPR